MFSVVMETVRPFLESGKVKWFGLSDCRADVLRRARAGPGVGEKLVAAQMEFSPFELGVERSGFLEAARELGVGIVAYSPLGQRLISGRYQNLALVDKFSAVAAKCDATPSQIALAWIISTYQDFVPIPGVERLEENARAAEITLSAEDSKEIGVLAREADVQGDRYPEQWASFMTKDCVPLSAWRGDCKYSG